MLIFCLIQLLFITVLCAVKIIYPNKQLNINNGEENDIIKYRKRHKRCKYCMYNKTEKKYDDWFKKYNIYYKCEVKDEIIYPNKTYRGCFCRYYKPLFVNEEYYKD